MFATRFLWYFDGNEQQYDFSPFRLRGRGLFPRLVFRVCCGIFASRGRAVPALARHGVLALVTCSSV